MCVANWKERMIYLWDENDKNYFITGLKRELELWMMNIIKAKRTIFTHENLKVLAVKSMWYSRGDTFSRCCTLVVEMSYLLYIMWFIIKNAGQITTQLSCEWKGLRCIALDDILLLVAIMLYLIDLSHSYTKQK